MSKDNFLSDYLRRIIDSEPGMVEWGGTHRDLVELVVEVAASGELRDDNDVPLTINELARRAYRAIGHEPPHHVAAIAYQLRNRLRVRPPLATRLRRMPVVVPNATVLH